MTGLALRGSHLEIDLRRETLGGVGLVTSTAGRSQMRADERKRGSRVIETGEFFPRLGRMTGLAAERLPIDPRIPHELVELALVGIGMTVGARQTAPPVERGGRFELRRPFMAIAANDRLVPACQREASVLVASQAEGGRLKSLQGMAHLTAV